MKILFFIGEFSEGGAERVISILSNSLVEKGYEIEILKYYKSENFYKTNKKIKITTVEENTNTRSKIKNINWLRNYINNNCDLLISFLAVFNMYALLANINKPIIVADRNDPRYMPKNSLLRYARNILYRKANAIVLQTEHNKEYFNKYIQSKSFVIKNPIDLKEKKGLVLVTNKEDLIVSVGRLEKQKNQELLIDAFKDIVDKYPTYRLIIFGEGPYRSVLEQRIQQLGLENKVSLPGNKKDIFEEISKAKLFILSSNYEGMPNALAEAMCLGLPCISTKVSGATEMINGNNGLLININNKEELTSSIEMMLSNEELRNNISKEAVKLNDELNIENIVNQWIEVINSI